VRAEEQKNKICHFRPNISAKMSVLYFYKKKFPPYYTNNTYTNTKVLLYISFYKGEPPGRRLTERFVA